MYVKSFPCLLVPPRGTPWPQSRDARTQSGQGAGNCRGRGVNHIGGVVSLGRPSSEIMRKNGSTVPESRNGEGREPQKNCVATVTARCPAGKVCMTPAVVRGIDPATCTNHSPLGDRMRIFNKRPLSCPSVSTGRGSFLNCGGEFIMKLREITN